MATRTHPSRRPRMFALLILSGLMAGEGQSVYAQMFEPQSVYGQGRRDASLEALGTIKGSERFLRRNRRVVDFVGRDRRDDVAFIGAIETGRRATPPDPAPLPFDRSPVVNRPADEPTVGRLYPPRLTAAFDRLESPPLNLQQSEVWQNLQDRGTLSLDDVAVRAEGRTIVLSGNVANDHQRNLLELLIGFEPGVSQVRNELRVGPPASSRAREL